ncbi:TLD-domain containing nucleolar protein isoform 2 [Hibiscus syriacus]|uniref:TLD-domain containing nucleolar protein isoform 2 n=1 Tax=Hibiscus syriacus TaxID=106335 RepID=A0A6A2XJQ5_HIBSY|nr:TLD-domain containing nucleolar protein isoform 2 [Hibiscus syriacus]
MGASSSTEQSISAEQRELESLAASTGALPLLQKSFSKLSDPQTNTISIQTLQQCFLLSYEDPVSESQQKPESLPSLLEYLGSSIVDLFFMPEKVKKSGLSSNLEFESDDADCKINGSLLPSDLLLLLWMCWAMLWNVRTLKSSERKGKLLLPYIDHLVLSAVVSCGDVNSSFDMWDCDILSLDVQLPVGKFLSWALSTAPTLSDCFTQFVTGRLQISVIEEGCIVGFIFVYHRIPLFCSVFRLHVYLTSTLFSSATLDEAGPSESISGDISSKSSQTLLLTRGRVWSVSLGSRSTVSEEILKLCFSVDIDVTDENLLYWSSAHGKGLNRFWSNVNGYHGKENFVYSHLHPKGRVYEAHPKPVGIAFGGTTTNERIFMDEDFTKLIVLHHAMDKTYQHGSLIPNQGFLPVEALISEVEVWGLGGKNAKEVQNSYKKREELFTEQRRKVDLKTFANWEDSPEKMMMDMMGDPNQIQREDR